MGKAETKAGATPGRRELLALAAVLAATVLTGGLAVAGLNRAPAPSQGPTQTVDGVVGQSQSAPRVVPGD